MRDFIETTEFHKNWVRLGLTDDDLLALQDFLTEFPEAGKIVKNTGGLRKVRWSFAHSGKRGGVRVLYLDIIIDDIIMLLDIYSKSEKESLTDNEKKFFKDLIKSLNK